MGHKELYVISSSPDVWSLFTEALADFPRVEITWLESVFSAVKLLEQSLATPFLARPVVIVVDSSTDDFKEPHIQDKFARLSKDVAVLAILPAAISKKEMPGFLDRIIPFDVLLPPLSAVEVWYRLRAALSYAECRTMEQFFERAITKMGAGMLILDTNETIHWLNPEAARLLGYETDDLLKRPLAILTGADAPDQRGLERGKRRPFKIRMIRQDGSRFWANCVAGNFLLPEQSGFTLVFTDSFLINPMSRVVLARKTESAAASAPLIPSGWLCEISAVRAASRKTSSTVSKAHPTGLTRMADPLPQLLLGWGSLE